MTSSAEKIRVVLGDEFDDKLRSELLDTLREYSAKPIGRWHGIGGSQEIERFQVEIEAESIEVESETYVGLSIFGDERIVNRIAARVRERMLA